MQHLTTGQAAQRLGLSRYTILRAAHRGDLAVAYRTPGGRFRFAPAVVAAYATDLRAPGQRTARGAAALTPQADDAVFRAIFDQAAVGLALETLDGQFVRVNTHLCQLLGYTHQELLAADWRAVTVEDDLARDEAETARLLATPGRVYATDKQYRRKDGRTLWGHLTLSVQRDAHGAPRYFLAVVEDASARVQAEEALRYQALHDTLTDLPNRTLWYDRVAHALATAARVQGTAALLLVDLNGFKAINDTFGHALGDRVLQQVALRLRETLRGADTVARLGGDEFGVLLADADHAEARRAARRIAQACTAPVVLDGRRCQVGGSLGIALYPEHGHDAQTLLHRADVAMYASKRGGRAYSVYAPAQETGTPDRLVLAGVRTARNPTP